MKDGLYLYSDHLKMLDSKRPRPGPQVELPIISREVYTPLHVEQWIRELSGHPDSSFASYILEGIQRGFRIGFDRSLNLVSASSNMHCNNPDIVSDYLTREVGLHRMWQCPKGTTPEGVHLSPLGIIPKKNKPGKWRMIVDLSSPQGASINDGISSEVASLQYTSVDHLASLVAAEGKGSYLVKADIQEAYRMVPVHPEDQHLLGVKWNGSVYIDKVLPFGLRSAPKIFSAVADALLWILNKKGITKGLHYLDDFVMVAKEHGVALEQKQALLSTFENFQVPMEQSKLEGPVTCLTFLGIEIDTVKLQLRLPRTKLADLKALLATYICHTSIPKKEIERITGLLQFTCKVVRSLSRPKVVSAAVEFSFRYLSIAVKELIPVVLAAALFGPCWAGKVVQFAVDNKAVVEVINATFCSDSHMMHLIRLLVFFAAKHNFWFTAAHIPGKKNVVADALSRNNMSLFRLQAPQADCHPVQPSAALVSLITQNITWTSTSWMKLFKDCTVQVYLQPPTKPIK